MSEPERLDPPEFLQLLGLASQEAVMVQMLDPNIAAIVCWERDDPESPYNGMRCTRPVGEGQMFTDLWTALHSSLYGELGARGWRPIAYWEKER